MTRSAVPRTPGLIQTFKCAAARHVPPCPTEARLNSGHHRLWKCLRCMQAAMERALHHAANTTSALQRCGLLPRNAPLTCPHRRDRAGNRSSLDTQLQWCCHSTRRYIITLPELSGTSQNGFTAMQGCCDNATSPLVPCRRLALPQTPISIKYACQC